MNSKRPQTRLKRAYVPISSRSNMTLIICALILAGGMSLAALLSH